MKIRFLRHKLLFTFFYVVFVALLWAFKVPCLFLELTGRPCPGCGMTNAYLALLKGDVLTAFSSHPMFWSLPIIYLFILFDGRVFRRQCLNYGSLILLGLGFLISWIGRVV